ncbi:hypothetical protein ACH49_14930 [Streptomyces leeuwenhoekii]|uniref:Uncharacterized protein n=1 Tax=Streptomyces leeuwenhoekii TaxID=1437453 RepID=A0ABR5HYE4_STRLW|nr:hypothetical protein ACH49_14930 [Streptomyces leeuwenhoekii]
MQTGCNGAREAVRIALKFSIIRQDAREVVRYASPRFSRSCDTCCFSFGHEYGVREDLACPLTRKSVDLLIQLREASCVLLPKLLGVFLVCRRYRCAQVAAQLLQTLLAFLILSTVLQTFDLLYKRPKSLATVPSDSCSEFFKFVQFIREVELGFPAPLFPSIDPFLFVCRGELLQKDERRLYCGVGGGENFLRDGHDRLDLGASFDVFPEPRFRWVVQQAIREDDAESPAGLQEV